MGHPLLRAAWLLPGFGRREGLAPRDLLDHPFTSAANLGGTGAWLIRTTDRDQFRSLVNALRLGEWTKPTSRSSMPR